MVNYPFLSIIIPTYNRARLLSLTVDSFLAQDYPKDRFEIILSNNNSTDNTREIIDAYCARHPAVKSILEPRQGVHYARNSAAKIAQGEILYFTDDDMIATPSLLTELVKVFDLDPLIASVTGKVIGRFDVPPPAWVKKHLINSHLSLTSEDQPEELIISTRDMVFSCHQAIRRDVFFRCGGFNPENTAGVWVGDGETGLGIRMQQAGYKFAYTPRSIIYHLIPESRTTLAYLIKRSGNQGNSDSYTDYRKHRDRRQLLHDLVYRNTVGFLRMMKTTLHNIRIGKESWHFIPATFAYILSRNRYDLKLYTDAGFRKLVEVDDWINEDSEKLNVISKK
jgi:glucosyl-dolichyl phosphate glucuronosyltransferase